MPIKRDNIFFFLIKTLFFVFAIAIINTFFVANWEEYHTGVLRTSMRIGKLIFGLTESQCSIMVIVLI